MSDQSTAMYEALQRSNTDFKVTLFSVAKTKQVLFLEAGTAFVDNLFSFLLLPVGTILHILSKGIQKEPDFHGLWRIARSVDSSFLRMAKRDLVEPRPASVGCNACLESEASLQVQKVLEEANILRYPLQSPYRPDENHYSNYKRFKGFVKDDMKFIITDDLEIIASTSLTTVSVLKRMEVASMEDLEGNEISVSVAQILQLLHSALTSSNSCLNDVFGLKKLDGDE